METEALLWGLAKIRRRLRREDLPEPRRADEEHWAALYREELEARASQGEEPNWKQWLNASFP
jgi:hypothetical protein